MAPPFPRAAGLGLTWRPMTEADLPFSTALYASTRYEELAPLGWPDAARDAFLAQQHEAQHRHYRGFYTEADWLILEADGAPVGRLYLDEGEKELRLIDIALVPDRRGRGLGGAIMADLAEWARVNGKAISLHVEPNNPARRLYARLGFESQGLAGAYEQMLLPAAAS